MIKTEKGVEGEGGVEGDLTVYHHLVSSTLYAESVKAMGESVGVLVGDEVAKFLAEDVTHRLKGIIQDAVKFMAMGMRRRLSVQDFDHALKTRNVEPVYGFGGPEPLPFRVVSGGGREVHYIEDKEVDLREIIHARLPKPPVDVALRTHWLAIDGVQPPIPENPPVILRDPQVDGGLEATGSAGGRGVGGMREGVQFQICTSRKIKFRSSERVLIKPIASHQLSMEQQLYYNDIVEACAGSDEKKRIEALQTLTNDPGLIEMLPKLAICIAEGVRVNVPLGNLALLIYFMRMVKSLFDNQALNLEKYLHKIIPSVMTCIVSKQLCQRPDQPSHFALRDFAATRMVEICKTYSTSCNKIVERTTAALDDTLVNNCTSLPAIYGAITTLSKLGNEVMRTHVIPTIQNIGNRIQVCLEGTDTSPADKVAAQKINDLICKVVPPVLKVIRSSTATDTLAKYQEEFGYFGDALYQAVHI